MFMTAVVFTYLANAPIGFGLEMGISTIIGLTCTLVTTVAFLVKFRPALVSSTSES
jgi:hypothetical protein